MFEELSEMKADNKKYLKECFEKMRYIVIRDKFRRKTIMSNNALLKSIRNH